MHKSIDGAVAGEPVAGKYEGHQNGKRQRDSEGGRSDLEGQEKGLPFPGLEIEKIHVCSVFSFRYAAEFSQPPAVIG
ncbi:hypothetical protein ROS1_45930 [Roseibium sp. ROS1]